MVIDAYPVVSMGSNNEPQDVTDNGNGNGNGGSVAHADASSNGNNHDMAHDASNANAHANTHANGNGNGSGSNSNEGNNSDPPQHQNPPNTIPKICLLEPDGAYYTLSGEGEESRYEYTPSTEPHPAGGTGGPRNPLDAAVPSAAGSGASTFAGPGSQASTSMVSASDAAHAHTHNHDQAMPVGGGSGGYGGRAGGTEIIVHKWVEPVPVPWFFDHEIVRWDLAAGGGQLAATVPDQLRLRPSPKQEESARVKKRHWDDSSGEDEKKVTKDVKRCCVKKEQETNDIGFKNGVEEEQVKGENLNKEEDSLDQKIKKDDKGKKTAYCNCDMCEDLRQAADHDDNDDHHDKSSDNEMDGPGVYFWLEYDPFREQYYAKDDEFHDYYDKEFGLEGEL